MQYNNNKRGRPTYGGSPETNAAKAKITFEITSWGRPDTSDVPALRERFQKYLELCSEYGVAYSNITSYYAIGITRQRASDWKLGRKTPEHQQLIEEIDMICSSFRDMSMQDGSVNPVVGIWYQKNFDGMKDVQEIQVTNTTDMLGEVKSLEQLKADLPSLSDGLIPTEYKDKSEN